MTPATPTTHDDDLALAAAIRALADTPEELRRAREQHSDWAANELNNYDE